MMQIVKWNFSPREYSDLAICYEFKSDFSFLLNLSVPKINVYACKTSENIVSLHGDTLIQIIQRHNPQSKDAHSSVYPMQTQNVLRKLQQKPIVEFCFH
jgi:hypothetical protein